MARTMTAPKNQVPIGRVTIGGVTYDVPQHPEFVRFFFDLFARVGGTNAPSNADLSASIATVGGGEMVYQPLGSDSLAPELMQAGCGGADFSDIVQGEALDLYSAESTFQG